MVILAQFGPCAVWGWGCPKWNVGQGRAGWRIECAVLLEKERAVFALLDVFEFFSVKV